MNEYPLLFNEQYPASAGCPKSQTRENTIKAFTRFCPKEAQVEEVEYFKQVDKRCEWHVIYNFTHTVNVQSQKQQTYYLRKIKEPLDVVKLKIRLLDHGMLKVIYSVLSCPCETNPI